MYNEYSQTKKLLPECIFSSVNQIYFKNGKIKMLIDTPSKTWERRLSIALKIEGVLFSTFWMLAYTMKFGMVWHDAGPPFGDTKYSWYFNMILAVYFVLGLYIFKIGNEPSKHLSLIGFLNWSSFAHLLVLIGCVFFDDTSSYAGPTFMGISFPSHVMGIAHWQNISPIGDVPLLTVFTFVDIYLSYKAFGSLLLPHEF